MILTQNLLELSTVDARFKIFYYVFYRKEHVILQCYGRLYVDAHMASKKKKKKRNIPANYEGLFMDVWNLCL